MNPKRTALSLQTSRLADLDQGEATLVKFLQDTNQAAIVAGICFAPSPDEAMERLTQPSLVNILNLARLGLLHIVTKYQLLLPLDGTLEPLPQHEEEKP